MRTNLLVTIGGIMAGFLAIPLGMATLGYPLPKALAMAMILIGMIGGIVTGVAAKGQDEHSTAAQVQLSTLENPQIQAKAVIEAKAEAKAVPENVPIIAPVPVVRDRLAEAAKASGLIPPKV
jgi:uncharacterized YccA/Bax inhibitor family protein